MDVIHRQRKVSRDRINGGSTKQIYWTRICCPPLSWRLSMVQGPPVTRAVRDSPIEIVVARTLEQRRYKSGSVKQEWSPGNSINLKDAISDMMRLICSWPESRENQHENQNIKSSRLIFCRSIPPSRSLWLRAAWWSWVRYAWLQSPRISIIA